MPNQINDPFASLRDENATRASSNSPNSHASTQPSTQQNLENIKISKRWTGKDLNRVIKNAIEGTSDPNRNCSMCCLNAFASNIKALYANHSPKSIPTHLTMIQASDTLVQKGYAKRLKDVPVTTLLSSKRVTSNTQFIGQVKDTLSPNISAYLQNQTPDNELMFFSVGIAQGYHSTLIAVSKNPKIDIFNANKKFNGTNENPFFIFIEDIGGARLFSATALDQKINEFISGAVDYYRGNRKLIGASLQNGKDKNIDSIVYILKTPLK